MEAQTTLRNLPIGINFDSSTRNIGKVLVA